MSSEEFTWLETPTQTRISQAAAIPLALGA
jgi:hypothetical protein